jgi:hypothetical protein
MRGGFRSGILGSSHFLNSTALNAPVFPHRNLTPGKQIRGIEWLKLPSIQTRTPPDSMFWVSG